MTPTPEYTDMKAFLRFFSERYLDQRIAAEQDRPMAVLERQELASPAQAPSALRMAVNNCMEVSSPWPLCQILALDAEMHGQGLPSLSSIRSRVWGRYKAMLKRGQLRSDDELTVAQAVLADRSLAQTLPEAERQALQAMVRACEARHAGGPGRASPAPTGPAVRRRSH